MESTPDYLPDLLIFVFIGFIFFLIDITTKDYKLCNNHNIYPIILIHHIVNIFAQFGWLSNNRTVLYLYIVAPVIVLIHWITNNNRCVLTEIINKYCNLNETEQFRDIWYLLGVKRLKYYNAIHYSYLVFVWLIALYKIYSNKT